MSLYLKSLTVKGFKSFASATTLDFEPGITCVVGPNGSGKSNVVDAIAWVMGEQGAKSLRGGKMDDVIFAGTSGRAPLGRAEVALTIDNSDGALAIDYTEVTITRTLFRSGGSEYQINGETCRLLDIQELLSDSGIGREMHVIVGQGRLDSILHATPEDRRGFIEEAAGVLKHRKRKEKALRKLEAMSANLMRVQDLTHELRRQLKPLGRQAEVARRSQVIQSDVRDSRLRLLADDLVKVRSSIEQDEADEALLRSRREELERGLTNKRARETQLESEAATDAPRTQRINEVHLRLTALRERFAGLIGLAAERASHLNEAEDERLGLDPDQLDRQAVAARQAYDEQAQEVTVLAEAMTAAETSRADIEAELAQATARQQQLDQAAAQRREMLARLAGDVQAASSRVESRDAEIERHTTQLADAEQRIAELESELEALTVGQPATGLSIDQLAADRDTAVATRDAVKDELAVAKDLHQQAQRDYAGITARIDALRLSLTENAGAGALVNSGVTILGSISDFVRVDAGGEAAVEAALATAVGADALAVASLAEAIAALRHVRTLTGSRVNVVVASPDGLADLSDSAFLDAQHQWVSELIHASDVDGSEQVVATLRRALAGIVLVEDLDQAQAVLSGHASLIAVTRDGDVLAAMQARGGDATSGRLRVVAAVEQAEARGREIEAQCLAASAGEARLEESLLAIRETARAAIEAFEQAAAEISDFTASLTLAQSRIASSRGEADRILAGLEQARVAHGKDVESVRLVRHRLSDLSEQPAQHEEDAPSADLPQLQTQVSTARQVELDARLSVRTAEERMRAHRARAEELTAAAAAEREARVRAHAQRDRRRRIAQVAIEVLEVAQTSADQLEYALASSSEQRKRAEKDRTSRDQQTSDVRAAIRDLASQIERLTTDVHRDEIARAEQKLRVEQLETKALEEFGVEATELASEYGPEVLVPPSAQSPGDEIDPEAPAPQPYPFVRGEQEKRLRTAEKSMALLGRVNPLALEEFAAMEERHTFLTTQLDDLKRSRKDLLEIVDEVDQRVQQVFAEAFADVQREFVGVFERLFPGGEGRLILTEPGDLLATGIEVEARPAGKRVKRLSLLSGGERSLTAVAFLVALFKARPSPFYLLDEVEAALDDVNLGRLIGLLEELRASSQLLVITHQKRTMEIADALYGVTMREGVTQVISQRIRELQPV